MSQEAVFLHCNEEEKDLPVWRDPSATREPDVSGNSRERSEKGSIF